MLRYTKLHDSPWQDKWRIFRYNPVKGQKLVKLPESPDPGFCDMNGGGVVVHRKIDQMTVTNPFDGTDSSCF